MVVVSAAARARDFAFESPLVSAHTSCLAALTRLLSKNVVSSGHKLADSAVRATLDVGKSSPDSGCIVDGTQTYGKTHAPISRPDNWGTGVGVKVEVKDEVKVEVRANVPNDHSGVNVEANASAKPPKDGKAKDEIKGAARDVDIHAEVKPELGLTEE
ncbi:hypothetical protein FRC10_011288 [Ceratobasidium sp. 414]|nr:hypothetical protein FRC10_011288 [Ceratobasidium sp. 414]